MVAAGPGAYRGALWSSIQQLVSLASLGERTDKQSVAQW
jgi:hypothetical protein